MLPEACASRYMNAAAGYVAGSGRAGSMDYNCKGCDEGKARAVDLGKKKVAEFKNGLKEVRKRAGMLHLETVKGENTMETTENSEQTPTKACRKCGKEKPVTDFNANFRSKDGRLHTCKACMKTLMSAGQKKRSAKKKGVSIRDSLTPGVENSELSVGWLPEVRLEEMHGAVDTGKDGVGDKNPASIEDLAVSIAKFRGALLNGFIDAGFTREESFEMCRQIRL